MRLVVWSVRIGAIALLLGPPAPAFAQGIGESDAPRKTVRPVQDGTAPLDRRVSINLRDQRLEDALESIDAQARLGLIYTRLLVPLDRHITIKLDSVTAREALDRVLVGTDVETSLTRRGQIVLARRSRVTAPAAEAAGAITGQVTDAKTGDRLVGAEISLDGTSFKTTSRENGLYRLLDVPAGRYTITARRVGYGKQTRQVAVTADEAVTVDLALEPVATRLNEIVTTVTGNQRQFELGHVVGIINADSLVREAPITSVSELLTGRVPGLQVFQNQGSVGGEVHVQIRGANSLLLGNEPIFVIDGVRYTSAAAPGFIQSYAGQAERSSPLNDIDPNDIATIEVVKGPSAATLYGTDASNGVIVITTKQGRSGPTRWNAYVRALTSGVPNQEYRNKWRGWGNAFGNPAGNCPLGYVEGGYCVQDSVTIVMNPLNDKRTSILQNSGSWDYGASTSGGSDALRYYFAANYQDAVGGVQLPPASVDRVKALRGLTELPDELLHPNAFSKLNLRANVSAGFGPRADLDVQAGYVSDASRALPGGSSDPYAYGIIYGTPDQPYGREGTEPAEIFNKTSKESTDRFFGSATGRWRPIGWLEGRMTVGQDVSSRNRTSLVPRGAVPSSPTWALAKGSVAEDRGRQTSTTGQLSLQANFRHARLSFRTSVGAQYVRSLNDVVSALGNDLPPGATSVGEAVNKTTYQTYSETATLGSYFEQMVGFNDRLFLTGAVRVDGASAFGQDYNAAAYPKVSASWLTSAEPFFPRIPGLDELRLRYAFGVSGRQADATMTRPSFAANPAVINGVPVTAIGISDLGNVNLQPERANEHELGFDASVLGNRLEFGLTWYRRRTTDAILHVTLPPGFGSQYTNVGLVKQHGFEVEMAAHVLDTRALSWDVMVQHGLHRTQVAKLGDAPAQYSPQGGWVEGYPVGARFVRPLAGYNDLDGNGIINPVREISFGDWEYAGESTPPSSQTLSTQVGIFDRRIRFSALFERRAGYVQADRLQTMLCQSGSCRPMVDPSSSLADQADVWGRTYLGSNAYLAKADFTRFRELSVAVDLATSTARALRVRSATVSFSGRNLALWTDFPAPDPESSAFTPSGSTDARDGANGIPQARTWTLRFDLGF